MEALARNPVLAARALAVLLPLAASTGCGRFVPPEDGGRRDDLLEVGRDLVQALRERDYPRLYSLVSGAYQERRSYEAFLASNRSQESGYELAPCRYVPELSRIGEQSSMLVFRTSFQRPGSPEPPLARRLVLVMVRDRDGWSLEEILNLPDPG